MDSDADFSAILPWFLEMIPFNVQTKNRNRVGGGMTPPYEQYAKLQFGTPLSKTDENKTKKETNNHG